MKNLNSTLKFLVSLTGSLLFAIIYFFYRNSLKEISGLLLSDSISVETIDSYLNSIVFLFGLFYSYFQLGGILLNNFSFNRLMGGSALLVGLSQILLGLIPSLSPTYIKFMRVLPCFGFVFANTTIFVILKQFAEEKNLSKDFAMQATTLISALVILVGIFLGKSVDSILSYVNSEKKLLLIIGSLSVLVSMIFFTTLPGKQENTNTNPISAKEDAKSTLNLIRNNKTLFLLSIFSFFASAGYFIFLELGYFNEIIFEASNNQLLTLEKIIPVGFSIGLLILPILHKIFGPENLLFLTYTTLSVLSGVIYMTYSHTPIYILYLFTIFIGFSAATQFSIFAIVEKAFSENGKSGAIALSLYNFFYMFSGSFGQIIASKLISNSSGLQKLVLFSFIMFFVSYLIALLVLRENKKFNKLFNN